MRFSSGEVTSKWQRLEKGIMAGCTVSVILFVANAMDFGMNGFLDNMGSFNIQAQEIEKPGYKKKAQL